MPNNSFTESGALEEMLSRMMGPAVMAAAEEFRDLIHENLGQPGTGKQGFSDRPDGHIHAHTASAPGHPPAPDTHALQNSIEISQSVEGGVISAQVGPNPDKLAEDEPKLLPAWLEYGTENIAPRPFMTPMWIMGQDGALELAADAARAALKGA